MEYNEPDGLGKESKNFSDTIKSRMANPSAGKTTTDVMAVVRDNVRPSLPRISGHYTNQESPDESNSSLSSTESDTFDTVPDAYGATMSKVDVNGILRYGSFDPDETGLSSVTSSGPSSNKRPFKDLQSCSTSQISFDDDRVVKRLALSPDNINAGSNANAPHPLSQLQNTAAEVLPKADSTQASIAASTSPRHQAIPPQIRKTSKVNRLKAHVRPRSSIPIHMSWEEYGRQCVSAAHASRLNPYALHPGEYRLLRSHITQNEVTTYLNIRNGILRLWVQNSMVSVSKEEAAGCAKDARFFDLAYTSYRWLVRYGYINFGCVEVPHADTMNRKAKATNKQKTIVVVGAGMAGLGCARQLEGLATQFGDHWLAAGELPPRVIVLEGRKRIGGRVYSHPLREQVPGSLPDGLRNTAEMGAQIITGFNHGNPLNAIVRGQLALHYHLMWDEITMYDSDGHAVNHERDMMVNKIHNDLLERTSDFRLKPTPVETLEGLPDYIDVCQDPIETKADKANAPAVDKGRQQAVPPGFAKLQGRTQVIAGNSSSRTAAQAIRSAGWQLRPGITKNYSLALDAVANKSSKPTLGATMDEAIRQYQSLVELTPQDMRLLNWHYADLEYANASVVSNLSLSGHDQDSGNEFEGRHSEVVGGYIQVPRGLMMLPTPLDVRFESVVSKIKYTADSGSPDGPAVVECANGEVFEADRVILTSPLGVLKAQTIAFEPSLPAWKEGAIQRIGFGLLNKVILVFDHAFWDGQYDMFGFLNEADPKDSLNPDDYATGRGRFYMMWNCEKNSGRPMLSALMSGRAAHEVETTDTEALIQEAMEKLKRTFGAQNVPAPVEVIVTRWKRDPLSRGTYSFVGPDTNPGDYDVMATPVGNLHFAGEATCGTHPATVHGAYLSGLRAAAEVMDSMVGQITVPEPLVLPRQTSLALDSQAVASLDYASPLAYTTSNTGASVGRPRKHAQAAPIAPAPLKHQNPYRKPAINSTSQDEEYEAAIIDAILSEIGPRPLKPARPGASVNPYLLFTNDHWGLCKEALSQARKSASGDSEAKATRDEIRSEVGLRWRTASDDIKRPYIERTQAAQQAAKEMRAVYERVAAKWDEDARQIRLKHMKTHPPANGTAWRGGTGWAGGTSIEVAPRRRQTVNYMEMSDAE